MSGNGRKRKNRQPLIYDFYVSPRSGPQIEEWSFEIIDREAPRHSFTKEEWEVVRRMIHTSGDFSLMRDVRFSRNVLASGKRALKRGCPIYADSNMIRAGLSLERLRSACGDYGRRSIHCHIADRDVARKAQSSGMPRSIHALRKAKGMLDGGIAVFGNAPIALLELNRMIMEEGVRPALVIAMPVGFVHVTESKEEALALDVPSIVLSGRRGGSPLAVSVVHALCRLASGRKGGEK
jgi:precorrin-8X/cobalt-precorrin-8 methylmutase